MKTYEKPVAEVVDFSAEAVMNAGVGGNFSFDEGDEPI